MNVLIEIPMTKATLYLTEPELVRLLEQDPELWREAIRRGKMIKRARAAQKPKEGKPHGTGDSASDN